MNGNDVGTRFGKPRDHFIGIFHHQMSIKHQPAVAAQASDHRRAESQVGNIVSVHYVQMQPVGAGIGHRRGFQRQPTEIGSQQTGGNQNHFSLLSFDKPLLLLL